jgi:putative endonuclease
MFYIYILKSSRDKSYYVGSCKNSEIRLNQHNKGVVKSTKKSTPWELVYFESYDNLKNTRKRERQIKSWKKRIAIENLIKHFKI